MALKIEKLNPAFGADIKNLDITRPLTDAEFADLRQAFTDYGLILIRGQDLSIPDQVALGRRFGEVQIHVMNQYRVDGHPEVYFLTNLDENGEPTGAHPDQGTLYWHTDASWRPRTGQATIMVAEQVPQVGGETHFCCMEAAYTALDADTKTRLSGLRIQHNLDFSRNLRHPHDPMTEQQKAEAPPVVHPLVRTHPESGRKSLLIGDHAECIEGMDYAEGRALIDDLNTRSVRPELVYEHRYVPGDVVIWDNRRMVHKSTLYDTATERRVMRRTTVVGEAPV